MYADKSGVLLTWNFVVPLENRSQSKTILVRFVIWTAFLSFQTRQDRCLERQNASYQCPPSSLPTHSCFLSSLCLSFAFIQHKGNIPNSIVGKLKSDHCELRPTVFVYRSSALEKDVEPVKVPITFVFPAQTAVLVVRTYASFFRNNTKWYTRT